MVAPHPVCHGCRCYQYNLHQSALGHQNPFHGVYLSFPSSSASFSPFVGGQTQSRSEIRYRHTLDAALTIYRSEGIRAFYRGLLPSLLGITHVAVQFPLYEKLKIVARAIPFSLSLLSPHPCCVKKKTPTERHSPDRPLAAHTILFCSAVAKMTASLATYPHEVVRTRLQTQRRLLLQPGAPRKRSGIVRTTAKILHFEGWRGLYKGLSVNLIRTVPNSAVTMLTCEKTISLLITAVLTPPQIRITDA